MNNINQQLSELIRKDPYSNFKVLIVVKPGTQLSEHKLTGYTRLMDNILSATLTGEQVMLLSKQDSVTAIELDAEMGAF